MAEPCPSDVPTGSDYSRTAVVDAWIKHFTEEDRKDAELFEQLMQVKIRSYDERLMKVWGNRDSYNDEQLEKMLEDMKKEEEEASRMRSVEYDEEEEEYRERLGAYYYKHVSEKFHSDREKKAATARSAPALPTRGPHSPRKILGQRPREAENPGRSSTPLKSPSRSSAGDEEPMSVVPKEEEPAVEKMEVEEIETKVTDNSMDSPRSQPDQKRPRGRPPKKSTSAAAIVDESSNRDGSPMSAKTSEEQKSPSRTETRRSAARGEPQSSTNAGERDSIHIVDSPAGRVRGARRPVAVDSPLVGKTSNVGRTSAGADSPDVREGSREREPAKSRHSTDAAPRPTSGVITDDLGGTGTQTALSIQMPLFAGGEGDAVSSRKSSRSERRSASATSSTPTNSGRSTVIVQTDEVKLDMEESIVIGWPLSDRKVMPPSTSAVLVSKSEREPMKTGHNKLDQSSRIVPWDDVYDGSFDKVCGSYTILFFV
ncbi:hypothetical protein COOONC_27186 [Cooperia oncophora]